MQNRTYCRLRLWITAPLIALGLCLCLWTGLEARISGQEEPDDERPTTQELASTGAILETKNMQLLGKFDGFVAQALNATLTHLYAYDGELAVFELSNPAAIRKIGGRATPNAGINAIERDGGLLYVSVDRPIGLGGDYLEILSTQPLTGPKLLGTYQPAKIQDVPLTGLRGIVVGSGSQLYVSQSDGIAVLDRFSITPEGKVPVIGHYASDVVDLMDRSDELLVIEHRGEGERTLELLSTGSTPQRLGMMNDIDGARSLAVSRQSNADRIYRQINGRPFLEIIDVSMRSNPVRTITRSGFPSAADLLIFGSYLYAAQFRDGVGVYWLGDPDSPIEVARYKEDGFSAVGLEWSGGRILASGNHDGLRVLQYSGTEPTLQILPQTTGIAVNDQPASPNNPVAIKSGDKLTFSQRVARNDFSGKCASLLLELLIAWYLGIEDELGEDIEFEPFDLFLDVLEMSPTLCEPGDPPTLPPVTRASSNTVIEARADLRMEKGAMRFDNRADLWLQSVSTPMAVITSRGNNDFAVGHIETTGRTLVRTFRNSVTVRHLDPEKGSVELPAGYQVEVNATGVGTPQFVGALYLPHLAR